MTPIRLLPLALLSVLVAGCVQSAGGQQEPSSPAASSAVASSAPGTAPEFGDGNAASQASSLAAAPQAAFANDQRLAEHGVLEIGNANAPLALTAFLNPSSPYSGQFLEDHAQRLLQGSVADGSARLQIVYVPFRKYPDTAGAAGALFCAGRQGKGREMNDLLFGLRTRDRTAILKNIKGLALDVPGFQRCLDEPGTASARAEQEKMIADAGVTLVPTFLFNGGSKYVGLMEYADLRGMIEEILRGSPSR